VRLGRRVSQPDCRTTLHARPPCFVCWLHVTGRLPLRTITTTHLENDNRPKKAVHAISHVSPRAMHRCTFHHRRPKVKSSFHHPIVDYDPTALTKGLPQCYTPLVIPHKNAVYRAHLGYIYPLPAADATCRLRPTHSTPHQPAYQYAAQPPARLILRLPHPAAHQTLPNLPLAHHLHVLSRAKIPKRDWTGAR
jgi:hypothetical protein